jgi:predicted nucleic acid-binding protein
VILVDTSVWIDHLRASDARLVALLDEGEIVCHPFVIGELALGTLRRPHEMLALMTELPQPPEADHGEVMLFIARHRLSGAGIGWVDAHLLCSAALGAHTLWTRDVKLRAAAARAGLGESQSGNYPTPSSRSMARSSKSVAPRKKLTGPEQV